MLVAAPPAFNGAWHEYRTAIGKACAEWSPSVLIQSTADAARGREKLSAAERSSTYASRILRWYPWISAGPVPDRLETMLYAIEAKDDITLAEFHVLLAGRRTLVGIGTLWRFFDRHRITRKKDSARY